VLFLVWFDGGFRPISWIDTLYSHPVYSVGPFLILSLEGASLRKNFGDYTRAGLAIWVAVKRANEPSE